MVSTKHERAQHTHHAHKKRSPTDFRQSNDENSKTIEPCQIMDLRVVGRHPVCLVDLAEPKFHYNWWTAVDVHLRTSHRKRTREHRIAQVKARAVLPSTFALQHQGWHGLVCCHRRAQERLVTHTLPYP